MVSSNPNLSQNLLSQPLPSQSSSAQTPPNLSLPQPSGRIVLNLDRVMLERKISLGDLADQVGISNVNLSKIKNNHVTAIRFSTLAALCKALNCQVSDLLEYHPE